MLLPPAGIVELAPFLVETTLPWRYGTIPGLEVISLCSDTTTAEFIYGFQRHAQLLSGVVPADFLPQHATPITVVLNDGSMRPEGVDSTSDRPVRTYTYTDHGALLLHIDMAAVEAGRSRSPTSTASTIGGGIPVSSYLNFLLETRRPAPPPWLRASLGELMNLNYSANKISVLRHISEYRPINPGSRRFQPVPLEEFFRGTEFGRRTREQVVAHLFQSNVLMHWALASDQGRNQKRFWNFATIACEQPVTEELFQQHFGVGYDRFERRLRGFWREDAFETVVPSDFHARNLPEPKPTELRDATETEVLLLRGYSEAMHARYLKQFARTSEDFRQRAGMGSPAPYFEKARLRLTSLFDDGERDPRLLAELGLVLCELDRGEEARPHLEAAAAGGVLRGRAYLELARLRSSEAMRQPAEPEGRLSAGQVAWVLQPLTIARRQPPALLGTYELMAETWGCSAGAPARGDIALLLEGAQLFPRELGYVLRAAEVCQQHGFATEAALLGAHGRKFAPDVTARARFLPFTSPAEPAKAGVRPPQ